ncbi:MAG: hypothetical protein AAF719_02695 [Pseudomonadota bacterium]
MAKDDPIERWAALYEARGFAGAGARETEEEKLIVERHTMDEFANSVREQLSIEISDIRDEPPPLPDFSARVGGGGVNIELTEFIDSELLRQAKLIKKEPDHPLNDLKTSGGLWFETNSKWFSALLRKTVEKKERKYQDRDSKIDILLVWNEALQVGIENTDQWLREFTLQKPKNISSVYFQSWYHPGFVSRPTWSIMPHPLLGEMKPVLKEL